MRPLDWAVVAAGAVAILAVNWWFFVAGRVRTVASPRKDATHD